MNNIFIGLQPISFGAFGNRIDNCTSLRPIGGIAELPVFTACSKNAYGSFRGWIQISCQLHLIRILTMYIFG